MRAATGVLAVLLTLSGTSLAQVLDERAAPVLPPVPDLPMAFVLLTGPDMQAAPLLPPVPALPAAEVQPTAPAQQVAAGSEASKPETVMPDAAGQPSTPVASTTPQSPTAATDAAYAAMANAADVPAGSGVPTVPFAPGARIYLEPMNGFEEYLAREIVKKKVPVVLVHDRLEADFILSGDAHVHKREFFTSFVLTTKGKGDVSIRDAHTGNEVFTHKFKRADGNMTPYLIYDGWAVGCAKDMRKTLEPKKKK